MRKCERFQDANSRGILSAWSRNSGNNLKKRKTVVWWPSTSLWRSTLSTLLVTERARFLGGNVSDNGWGNFGEWTYYCVMALSISCVSSHYYSGFGLRTHPEPRLVSSRSSWSLAQFENPSLVKQRQTLVALLNLLIGTMQRSIGERRVSRKTPSPSWASYGALPKRDTCLLWHPFQRTDAQRAVQFRGLEQRETTESMKEENKQGRDNRIWRNNRRRIDEAVSLEANKIEDNIRKRRREWELTKANIWYKSGINNPEMEKGRDIHKEYNRTLMKTKKAGSFPRLGTPSSPHGAMPTSI